MTDGDTPPTPERGLVEHLLEKMPSVAAAIAAAKQLNAVLGRKTSESLSPILNDAAKTPLKWFAASPRRDITAIEAALDLA